VQSDDTRISLLLHKETTFITYQFASFTFSSQPIGTLGSKKVESEQTELSCTSADRQADRYSWQFEEPSDYLVCDHTWPRRDAAGR